MKASSTASRCSYVEAWARGDVGTLRALLAEDAVFSMPPWPVWWSGGDAIAGFAKTAVEVCSESRKVATRANGQLAIGSYSLDAATGRYEAAAIDVFTFDGASIKEITAFVIPQIFPRFGLPPVLAPERAPP
jgi:RNA polymerase sigma-70 factor, ECF subfamily